MDELRRRTGGGGGAGEEEEEEEGPVVEVRLVPAARIVVRYAHEGPGGRLAASDFGRLRLFSASDSRQAADIELAITLTLPLVNAIGARKRGRSFGDHTVFLRLRYLQCGVDNAEEKVPASLPASLRREYHQEPLGGTQVVCCPFKIKKNIINTG
ncbi:hypothetical protein F2P81_019029 [Scophthalmus maximus]|uniref:Uncharacterized protein n=1 Tax=Scophthalmus maximus TaxID=52904 RepID=A0A6A4SG76_SCOMX|nr:hypothetical protein F2P81_019029 [Scophthalmus maximus]